MLRLNVSKEKGDSSPPGSAGEAQLEMANMQDADFAKCPSGVRSPLVVNHYSVLQIKD